MNAKKYFFCLSFGAAGGANHLQIPTNVDELVKQRLRNQISSQLEKVEVRFDDESCGEKLSYSYSMDSIALEGATEHWDGKVVAAISDVIDGRKINFPVRDADGAAHGKDEQGDGNSAEANGAALLAASAAARAPRKTSQWVRPTLWSLAGGAVALFAISRWRGSGGSGAGTSGAPIPSAGPSFGASPDLRGGGPVRGRTSGI